MYRVPNKYRITKGLMGSTSESHPEEGAFAIPSPIDGAELIVVASNNMGWEHVSVSRKNRCPNWPEMCHIKNLFWDKTDTVIQYHPSEENYVNNHPNCLHMWRPTDKDFPIPQTFLVGIK